MYNNKNMAKDINRDVSIQGIQDILILADRELNFYDLLNKFGPEGLYLIADKLKEIADKDMIGYLDENNV